MSEHCCAQMSDTLTDDETALFYVPKFREYGFAVLDGGSSYIQISFCPWCGRSLPGSLRTELFDELDRRELTMEGPALPVEFLSDEWWKKRCL